MTVQPSRRTVAHGPKARNVIGAAILLMLAAAGGGMWLASYFPA